MRRPASARPYREPKDLNREIGAGASRGTNPLVPTAAHSEHTARKQNGTGFFFPPPADRNVPPECTARTVCVGPGL